MSRHRLAPGDLIAWAGSGMDEPDILLVSEDGESLWFQFAPNPWHQMQFTYDHGEKGPGLTIQQAEDAIRLRVYPVGFPGYVYKCYDAATGASYTDPLWEERDESR